MLQIAHNHIPENIGYGSYGVSIPPAFALALAGRQPVRLILAWLDAGLTLDAKLTKLGSVLRNKGC